MDSSSDSEDGIPAAMAFDLIKRKTKLCKQINQCRSTLRNLFTVIEEVIFRHIQEVTDRMKELVHENYRTIDHALEVKSVIEHCLKIDDLSFEDWAFIFGSDQIYFPYQDE